MNAGSHAAPKTPQEWGARVMDFLSELQSVRSKPVPRLDQYADVLWIADLPVHESLSVPGLPTLDGERPGALPMGASADAWLVVENQARVEPPTPPAVVAPWIAWQSLWDSQHSEPALRSPSGEPGDHAVPDEVRDAFQQWLPSWQMWADQDRPHAAAAAVYQRLYTMHTQTSSYGETYEATMAFGLVINGHGEDQVRRHLVNFPAVVDLDVDTGRLTVMPSPERTMPRIEQEMLPADRQVSASMLDDLTQGLAGVQDPWDDGDESVEAVLQAWVAALGDRARYHSTFTASLDHDTAGQSADDHDHHFDGAEVYFAPALILRERTTQSVRTACETVARALRSGVPLPEGMRQFVELTDGQVTGPDLDSWRRHHADGEVYFTAVSNAEQRHVVGRIADQRMVVVQGPPGTGKTHTIANLITDLVAHGQRVLVTSATARALKVLKDKLPAEIAGLCVSAVDESARGQADLEASVQQILGRADTWNQEQSDDEADQLMTRLAASRERVDQARQQLRAIRDEETQQHEPEIGDYQGTLAQIAERLRNEEEQFKWIAPVSSQHPTMSVGDLRALLQALREFDAPAQARCGSTPDPVTLPDLHEWEGMAHEQAELGAQEINLAEVRRTAHFEALANSTPAQRQETAGLLGEMRRARHDLGRRPEPWVLQAVSDVESRRDMAWRQQLTTDAAALNEVRQALTALQGNVVTGLDSMDPQAALAQVTGLVQFTSRGGKLRGLFGRTKEAKAAATLLDGVRVNGREPDDAASLEILLAQAVVNQRLRETEEAWGYPDQSSVPVPQRLAVVSDELAVLDEVLQYGEVLSRVRAHLDAIPGMPPLDPANPEDCERILQTITALQIHDKTQHGNSRMEPALRHLRDLLAHDKNVAPVVRQLVDSLERWDIQAYRAALEELTRARAANDAKVEVERLRGHIADYLPHVVTQMTATAADPVWDTRVSSLREAWAWAVWDQRLSEASSVERLERLRAELDAAEFDTRQILAELAANRAWSHCLGRLSPRESSHLQIYTQSLRRMGRGTGRFASRHRQEAQRSLEACQTAIPAWVMPMHQVFATVPLETPNLFDVVIVDEASQAGMEGLLLSWLAPRIVVVGDDRQVSPSQVGVNHDAVYRLQDHYLGELEHRALFSPMSSFFDHAVGMSSSRVMLREHFRCMPEIIGFSNEMMYRGNLIPLKQYGLDRLDPIKTVFVPEATVSGRRDPLNYAEAEALVAQVVACCEDPAYAGRSMGVITLQGDRQAPYIMQRLVHELGVTEVENRRIRAGSAEAFQGDERDIIFISMVCSRFSTEGEMRIGTLSREADQQRFNVAASRAREQVWLFHSVELAELSERDLRRQYLSYLLDPPSGIENVDLGDVRDDVRHPAFTSLFHQKVYRAIGARGFQVRPRVSVGEYVVDLVIDGGTQQVAVVCEDDQPMSTRVAERADACQRDLRRLGWSVLRVRASSFTRDAETAMEPIWRTLTDRGIVPTSLPLPESTAVAQVPAQSAGPHHETTVSTGASDFSTVPGSQVIDVRQAGSADSAAEKAADPG